MPALLCRHLGHVTVPDVVEDLPRAVDHLAHLDPLALVQDIARIVLEVKGPTGESQIPVLAVGDAVDVELASGVGGHIFF